MTDIFFKYKKQNVFYGEKLGSYIKYNIYNLVTLHVIITSALYDVTI